MVLRDWSTALPLAVRVDDPDYLVWRSEGNTPDPADPIPPENPVVVADRDALASFPTRAQVQNALTQIDTDLTTLSSAITLAQATPILRRTVQNQRAVIRALTVLVYRGQG